MAFHDWVWCLCALVVHVTDQADCPGREQEDEDYQANDLVRVGQIGAL